MRKMEVKALPMKMEQPSGPFWMMLSMGIVALICLLPAASKAGSATAESTRGQMDALQQARQRMPPGATMSSYECSNEVQPMVKKVHRCTVFWDDAD
jgi:hypothetical protein